MLADWRAGVTALRAPLMVGLCISCFVLGSLMATPAEAPAPPLVTQPTAAVTDESVRDLVDALHDLTTDTTVPPTASSVVAEAEAVLEAVESGQVHVIPTPTSPPPPSPPTTTTTAPPPPASTTSTLPLLEWPEDLPEVTLP